MDLKAPESNLDYVFHNNIFLQPWTVNRYTTDRQHINLSTSRLSEDKADLVMLQSRMDSLTPIADDKSLHHIITGDTEDEDVNVHDVFTIGNDVIRNIDSHSVFSYSQKRSSKVKTLASGSAVKVAEDGTMDIACYFRIS